MIASFDVLYRKRENYVTNIFLKYRLFLTNEPPTIDTILWLNFSCRFALLKTFTIYWCKYLIVSHEYNFNYFHHNSSNITVMSVDTKNSVVLIIFISSLECCTWILLRKGTTKKKGNKNQMTCKFYRAEIIFCSYVMNNSI